MSDLKWVIRHKFRQRAVGADELQESLTDPTYEGRD